MTMNAQNATYQGAQLPAKFRRGLVRNVIALGLSFLSVGVYARASAHLGLTESNPSPICHASGAGGLDQGQAADTATR
jgi:hypothetical protein